MGGQSEDSYLRCETCRVTWGCTCNLAYDCSMCGAHAGHRVRKASKQQIKRKQSQPRRRYTRGEYKFT
jgi:hypothetical protein